MGIPCKNYDKGIYNDGLHTICFIEIHMKTVNHIVIFFADFSLPRSTIRIISKYC